MRLKRLSVTNFRGIAHLELTFPETAQTTVLVGINGAGKSSVLDAIALALIHRGADRSGLHLRPEDIRAGQSDFRVDVFADYFSDGSHQSINWDLRASLSDPQRHVFKSKARSTPRTSRPDLMPAVAYYSVDRMVRGDRPEDPPDGIIDAGDLGIRSGSSDYATFFEWFEAREDLENELIRDQPSHREPELEVVRRAIEVLLPGFRNLRVRRTRAQPGERPERSRLVVTKGDQTLELGQLSHGERGLLAMTGDIARRLALVGPESLEPGMRPGIVLIDEIDLHLHPQWQREVVPRLEGAFPGVQFIVTTHSPQVVSQLHPDSVRILEDFAIVPNTPPTFGRDTNAILSEVMGVEERPRFAGERLHEIARLMDEERWKEARAGLDALARDFGEHDSEILRLGTMIDILEAAPEAPE
ncbi:MAG: AAA family ATPase [Nannocystis sp.]|nr:AAA family ATPase [Nannocystis sp.]MBA3549303.1 AAA family ATPase [Nannocystis sp.]